VDGLIDAILERRIDDALLAIQSGADVNTSSEYGTTPLSAAWVQGDLAIVRPLIDDAADPNAASLGETEGTPLCAAAA
jgi:ankyrin repeat protein